MRARADGVMAKNLTALHNDFELSRAQGGEASEMEAHVHSRWRNVDEIMTHAACVNLAAFYTGTGASPAFRDFLERCLELDDSLRSWRQSHIPLVERIIGARPGTGGGGIAYSAFHHARDPRVSTCLWEFRSILTR